VALHDVHEKVSLVVGSVVLEGTFAVHLLGGLGVEGGRGREEEEGGRRKKGEGGGEGRVERVANSKVPACLPRSRFRCTRRRLCRAS
jgi:hypothetical protein